MNMRTMATLVAFLVLIAGGVALATPPALPPMTAEEKKFEVLVEKLCKANDAKGLLLALEAGEKMEGKQHSKSVEKVMRKLGELKHRDAVELLSRAIAERGSPTAIQVLSQIGGPKAVETLLNVADSTKGRTDKRSRTWAIVYLGRVDDVRITPTLLAIVSDAEDLAELRRFAIQSLWKKKLTEPLLRKVFSLSLNLDDPFATAGFGYARNPEDKAKRAEPALVTPLIEVLTTLLERSDMPLPAGDAAAKAVKEKTTERFLQGLTALEWIARDVAKGTEYSVMLRQDFEMLKGDKVHFSYNRGDVRASQAERKRVLALWTQWWNENKPAPEAPPKPAE